jgi:hypothetical protein
MTRKALKTNFFLRGFFKRRGFFNLSDLTPSEYLLISFFFNYHLKGIGHGLRTSDSFHIPT